MTYTTTIQDGQLTLPTELLAQTKLSSGTTVKLRSTHENLLAIEFLLEQAFTVEEARQLFPNEWVFMHITQRDESGMVCGGSIVAHSSDYDEIGKIIKPWVKANPGVPNYFFYNGEMEGIDGVVV